MAPERIKFYTDTHIAAAVTKALRTEGVDIVRAHEVGLADADDLSHLEFAVREGRVLVTKDSDFLAYHQQGRVHAGIAYFQGAANTGYIIGQLLTLRGVMDAEEIRGVVQYL